MPRRTPTADASRQDEVYRCLSHHRRRRILSIVAERDSPLSESDLAARISEAESPAAAAGDRRGEIESLLVDLRHVHLPALSEAGLVDWDRDRNAVASADHPSLRDAEVVAHLDRLDDSWDRFVSALAHRYRRLALSIASRRKTLALDALAGAVVDRERERGADVSTDRVRVSLHHTHLPQLDDAGLLEYDADERTVTFQGHPAIEDDWFVSEMDDPARAGSTLVSVPL